jgi:hypothetical protein
MAYALYALGIVILISAFIAQRITSHVSVARFKRKHGCKPEHKIPQFERIIGYDLYRIQMNASKEKRILEVGYKRYQDNGNTWSASMMGKTFFNTIDPENVKAILASNFNDFGIGQRLDAFGALLGRGIFTSDGKQWEHSRVSPEAGTAARDCKGDADLIFRLSSDPISPGRKLLISRPSNHTFNSSLPKYLEMARPSISKPYSSN